MMDDAVDDVERVSVGLQPLLLGLAACGIIGISFMPTTFWELFTLGTGESAALLGESVPRLLLILGACLFVFALLFCVWGRNVDSVLIRQSTCGDRVSSRELVLWFFLASAFVLSFDHATIRYGFFESDDFYLLSHDREHSLGELMATTHNDHVIVLLRAETRIMQSVFGGHVLPYNIAILCSFVFMLTAGCWLMRECAASRLATFIALTMCVAWTPWGQFTTGAIILQKYMQIMTLTAIGAWAWLLWERTGRSRWLCLMFVCISLCCWMNLSGFWTPLALLAFAVCSTWGFQGMPRISWDLLKMVGPWAAATVATIVSAALFDGYVFGLPDPSLWVFSAALLHETHPESRIVPADSARITKRVRDTIRTDRSIRELYGFTSD